MMRHRADWGAWLGSWSWKLSCSSPPSSLLEHDLRHGGNPLRTIVETLDELERLAPRSAELFESDLAYLVDRLQAVGHEPWAHHHHVARTAPGEAGQRLVRIRLQPDRAAGARLVRQQIRSLRPSGARRQRLYGGLTMQWIRVAA